jgi:hypothetical protein
VFWLALFFPVLAFTLPVLVLFPLLVWLVVFTFLLNDLAVLLDPAPVSSLIASLLPRHSQSQPPEASLLFPPLVRVRVAEALPVVTDPLPVFSLAWLLPVLETTVKLFVTLPLFDWLTVDLQMLLAIAMLVEPAPVSVLLAVLSAKAGTTAIATPDKLRAGIRKSLRIFPHLLSKEKPTPKILVVGRKFLQK